MKKTLLVAVALLGSASAMAQTPFTTTQNPPAGGSSQSTPQPTNSLPQAAGTERPTLQPGSNIGTTETAPRRRVAKKVRTPRRHQQRAVQ